VNAWKVIVAALVIFAAGVVTGGLTVKLAGRKLRGSALPPIAQQPVEPAPPVWQRMEALRRMDGSLRLSPEQRERIDALVRESQDRVRRIWEPVQPETQREFRELRERIRRVLDDRQRPLFDELLRRRATRRPEDQRPPDERRAPRRNPDAPSLLDPPAR